jgi:hypothetical protein
MQEVNFGRIERLQVKDGEPIFDPPPTKLQLFMFGKNNGASEYRDSDGFALTNKMTELFEIFDRKQSLLIQELMIDNGLPVRMIVKDTVRI